MRAASGSPFAIKPILHPVPLPPGLGFRCERRVPQRRHRAAPLDRGPPESGRAHGRRGQVLHRRPEADDGRREGARARRHDRSGAAPGDLRRRRVPPGTLGEDRQRARGDLQHRPQMTLLYAIGIGALVNVAVAILGRLLRFTNARFDPSGESLVVGVAAAVIVATLGLAAREQLVRIALLGLAAHAALLLNRFLGVAFKGRTPSDGSIDAFQYTPLALALLVGGMVLGVAVGLIYRGFR